MIFALGSVSGAHFNPAVTLAIVISGRDLISYADAAAYMATQLLGGLLAGATYMVMENFKTFPLGPGAGYAWRQAMAAEIVFTFVLCFVVLCVATIRKPLSQYF